MPRIESLHADPTGAGASRSLLAEIFGKGIAAALLTADLQATLRSQSAVGADDLADEPARPLDRANGLFFAPTLGNHYATLFLAEFDRATRGLRHVNCGHVPPVLVRADRAVQTLDPPAP